jgi:xanthine dehydrogenase large subunit
MKNIDSPMHTRGESLFLDDTNPPSELLHAAVLPSPLAHGKIKLLDVAHALRQKGVVKIFTHEDIPGENQIGPIIQDEPLLAEGEVHFSGQPVAVVVAETKTAATKALKHIKLEIEAKTVITDPRVAFAKGELIAPSRTFSMGNVQKAWKECEIIVSGRVDSGAQEHFYMEPQGAIAMPWEMDGIKVISSTQSPTGVQRTVAKVLGIDMNAVEVETGRLGGGFGGKEDQAAIWACLAALSTSILKVPVKLVLNRQEDMLMTGKRHPYSSDFQIGLKANGKIVAFEAFYYQDGGASADLSTAIMARTLFHATNTYFIPNVKVTAVSCRTNYAPNTACRGFGAPQAMLIIESAMQKAAEKMKVRTFDLQKINLLEENDMFPYGQRLEGSNAKKCWQIAEEKFNFNNSFNRIKQFNSINQIKKKGMAIMPICFGISFTNTPMNQAGALVHVYSDGSVSVSTGAVEMGQGVNMKILQIVAENLSISMERLKMEKTNTTRVANTSPTAASTGTDLNGKAAENACRMIMVRLKKVAANILGHPSPDDIKIINEIVYVKDQKTNLKWLSLISKAYLDRINLSAQGYYATPGIGFDSSIEKGKPLAYHVFGTSITEITLDCLRGTYDIDSVKLIHDVGKSINPLIDRGQVEGGLIQGIGWLTIEELIHNEEGILMTNTASTYKIPDIKFTPKTLDIRFLKNSPNPKAVSNSKAVGEPPFMYGIGTYFAIVEAMKAFRPGKAFNISAPLTPEKILCNLYD